MKWSSAYPLANAPLPPRPGIYKILLADARGLSETALAGVETGDVLYVGKAEESVLGRDIGQHLHSDRTGSSTLRRSLGAILHDRLILKARLRGDRHRSSYCFHADGEDRLTKWMRANLSVAWLECASGAEAKAKEPGLIKELRPALNITHNTYGSYVRLVRQSRTLCRNEAARDCSAQRLDSR